MGQLDLPAQPLREAAHAPATITQSNPVDPRAAPAPHAGLLHDRIAASVGQLYAQASLAARGRLIETLLRPIGIVALLAVSNGLFARIKAGNAAWQAFRVRDEDIDKVGTQDIVALAALALQVNDNAARDLSAVIGKAPDLAATAAGAALQPLLRTLAAAVRPVARQQA